MDAETIKDAGFDAYLSRNLYGTQGTDLALENRYVDASSLVGGIIGGEGIIYLGSKQIKLDGKNRRITINDGVNERVLIGGF